MNKDIGGGGGGGGGGDGDEDWSAKSYFGIVFVTRTSGHVATCAYVSKVSSFMAENFGD